MNVKWADKKLIGQGGNGKVYRIRKADGKFYAVKILSKVRTGKAYQRFKDEIKILGELENEKGVIKILEYNLPDKFSKENQPYYIMPLAMRLDEYLRNKTYTQFYSIIIKLLETLVELHNRNITHRDIKPDNILVVDDVPVFSDFGLAHFPKKEKISHLKEKIGAKWTIAPEMKRISSAAEFKKADIYSFAKTLYILITKQDYGFEGQYIPKSSISIDNFINLKINDSYKSMDEWRYQSFVLLEKIFISATDNNPDNRPDAIEFLEKLNEWYNTNSIFGKRNIYEWEHCLTRIFPVSIPESCSWNSIKEIHGIFQLIFKEYDQLNYSFFPEHGGNDLIQIEFAKEENCLIINDHYIINPKRLTFESMTDLDFSYFYLELNSLNAIDTDIENEIREDVFLNKEKEYSREDNFSNMKCKRYLKGSFIITRKTSILNQIRGDLDGHFGIHHQKTSLQYKSIIEKLISEYKKHHQLTSVTSK